MSSAAEVGEVIRQLRDRVDRLENASTVRVGPWVLSNGESGGLVATKPGKSGLTVGADPVEPIVADLTRGFVSAADVNNAVTGAAAFGPLQPAADFVSDLLTNITNGSVEGAVAAGEGALEDAFNSLQRMFGIGSNAQTTANDAWSAILAMKAILGGISIGTGTSGSDNMDGAATANMSGKYTELIWGAAANRYRLNGSGRAVFSTGGPLGNNVVNIYNANTFIGNAQTTAFYLPLRIPFNTAMIMINNFSWSTTKEAACVYITPSTVQAGFLTWTGSAFTLNTLGAANGYTQADGEFWQFDYGDVTGGSTPTVTNSNMYRLFRNSDQVLSFDDSASPHITLDANHNAIAWGAISATNITGVIPAADVDSFAFWERA